MFKDYLLVHFMNPTSNKAESIRLVSIFIIKKLLVLGRYMWFYKYYQSYVFTAAKDSVLIRVSNEK